MLKLTDEDFNRLVSYIKNNYGINLQKKRVLIEGRLTNVVKEKGYAQFKPYLDTVFRTPKSEEMVQLVNRLTTNHTFFLREPEHFEFMKSTVLPWIDRTCRNRVARIWCAASSTGQEPYTMAMTIADYFGARKSEWDCRILATDISTDALTKAKLGVYTTEMVQDVPAMWLSKYFKKIDADHYQVIDAIRKEVIYKQFNLMDPISYQPFDFISCRNVMIYFDGPTKDALVNRFYNVTKPGGYFFIGHAESVNKGATQFQLIKPAIYRRAQ